MAFALEVWLRHRCPACGRNFNRYSRAAGAPAEPDDPPMPADPVTMCIECACVFTVASDGATARVDVDTLPAGLQRVFAVMRDAIIEENARARPRWAALLAIGPAAKC